MDKTFSINHPLLFILAGICVAVVILQSVVFLVRAWKRAKAIGFTTEKLKGIAITSALFSIAPAIAIGIGVFTLVGSLGLPLPWVRLSVVGALTYELSAAETAAAALGTKLGQVFTAQQFSTIAWTMTVGITPGVFLIPILCKPILSGVSKIGQTDKKWGELFVNSIFIGLVATFVGKSLSGTTVSTEGLVSSLVLATSAVFMVICGILKKKLKWEWLSDYALPISMILSMACAILYTNLLG